MAPKNSDPGQNPEPCQISLPPPLCTLSEFPIRESLARGAVSTMAHHAS
ncbi:hypothetical protein CCACVL1_06193 [Corchorus capsularis]|uniref:Uncharacterized protein n=1 Tax=Corchorus capsularis TaxID=210143 RepID=A0A1R3JGY1_COCAP|nr:hypothetical protein CCACVL1_06193 [Corchorus capsularis]